MTDPTSTAPPVGVILVAAGEGLRLEAGRPKAFVELAGRPILAHALDAIAGIRRDVRLVIAVPGGFEAIARELVLGAGLDATRVTIVVGGASRQASVGLALARLADDVEVLLVHDAARPLAPPVLFDAVIAEVEATGAAVIPGLPVTDTVKRVGDDGAVVETLERSQLRAVQTPQGFPRAWLEHGHAAARDERTDDAALVSDAGYPVRVVAGDERASKITTAWELRRTEQSFARGDVAASRVGTGTDVHAYDASAPLWLGGLHWPGEPGLAGHSDGDVVAHAICDAVLAAARLGDVGAVFGIDEPAMAGAAGDDMLRTVLARLDATGLRVVNVTVQVVGERPRIAPRRAELESHLASILGAPVSVAGTTSDGLGVTGRGEGVAAIATALLAPAPR